MKLTTSIGATLVLQITASTAKSHSHGTLAAIDRRHHHQHKHAARHAQPSPAEGSQTPEKRGQTCQWPSDQGLVFVPGAQNGGWAMSPDQPCLPGNWCQYACPPSELMTSWNPAFVSYPSKDGGVFCGLDGNIVLPSGPLCKQGATNIQAVDATGKGVSFCQTVAPGNEAQLIPTWVSPNSEATLAIPQPDYFGKIAAHYYINEPGADPDISCLWGDSSTPLGNWAALVGGGVQTADGRTWIDLGLNPIYADTFSSKPIDFKVEIICDGECNNPCAYDPSQHGLLEMVGTQGTNWNIGDGGVPYCTTCVTSGSAYYKVSMLDGSDAPSGPSGSGSSSSANGSGAQPTKFAAAASSSPSGSSTGSTKTKGSSSSGKASATATTYSAHLFLQQTPSASTSAVSAASTSAAGSAGVIGMSTASAASASSSSSSAGATSHFAAPAAGLALTGLAALLFL